MKKIFIQIFKSILAAALLLVSVSAQENQKLAQTSLQFLTVVSDARAVALGEATTGLQMGSSALFFNPAGMSEMENFIDVTASNNKWIVDINHYTLSAAINPFKGEYGVLGFSLQYVDYGSFIETRVNKAIDKGYDDVGLFNLNAMAFGVGYATRLTDQFSVGAQVRYARQNLGTSLVPELVYKNPVKDSLGVILYYQDSTEIANNKVTPLVFDFGTQFKTGIKSLVFGMSIRNFSKEMKYAYEGFQLPLVFTLGISMNLMDLAGEMPFDQSLYMSVDASHHRDHPEQVKIGLEYKILNMVALRGGYVSNTDEGGGLSYGLGVSQFGFAFDYSYTPFGVFNNVQRMTARFSF